MLLTDQHDNTNATLAAAVPLLLDDNGMYDIHVVCRYFGGTRPLHMATIYRGMEEGRYPRPVRVSPGANRWLGRELKACRQALIDSPREPLLSPRRRERRA
jgi:predicted DNA-binding transcriptional regulator AlpA